MIDARGYSCPTPLLMVQKYLKEHGNPNSFEVAVDHQCAIENITRFGKDNGYKVTVSDFEGDFKLSLSK